MAYGRWVGFFEGAELKKISITGGPPMPLCRFIAGPPGASWGADDTIVFAKNDLRRPDDRRDVLFTIVPMSQGAENAQVAVLDLKTGERKTLIRGGSHAEYVETGHLVYATGGTLRAVRFDLARLEVTSDAFPVGGIGGSSADHIHR